MARGVRVIITLVAVIGLTLTAVTGCATSDDSASTVASEFEANETMSLRKDCGTVMNGLRLLNNNTPSGEELIRAFAKIWPQLNDPDLKSIFRSLSSWNKGLLFEQPDWLAYESICGVVFSR